ncbi:MAG: hypothetical protein HYU66_04900 [Armatimonadetes bacterium]|nr:hypothetical protein [Armatimonadota bacterium]
MRMMMTVRLNTARANDAARSGKLGETIGKILEQLRPEAAYFVADNGLRTGFLFFDMAANSDVPAAAEPWFLAFDAEIEIQPAMVIADLQQAGPGIQAAVKAFG